MSFAGFTLLVVDDQQENRDVLSRRLERKGYRVLTASGGREALEVLEQEHVDVLLLDLMMPEMSGLQVLARVRSQHAALELPVIMVSAVPDTPQIVEALSLGANDYVTKPVDFPVCLARVEGQLARRQAAHVPPAAFRPEVGGLVAHYRLESLLGEGGMGLVFRARDTRLDRVVALKVLQTGGPFYRPESAQRFAREARAAARVRHPNVVPLFDLGEEPCPYLVMECVEGGDLERRVEGGALGIWEATGIAVEIAEALVAIHGCGVVHRDLKPGNVLFDASGAVRVTDFGLARLEGADVALTQQGSVVGTPSHMAPEQLDSGFGTVGPATDLWALGVILYEMLTGRLPFEGEGIMQTLNAIVTKDPVPPRRLRPEVPPNLEAVCLRALRRNPGERHGSAREMRDALRACLESM